MKFLKRSIRSYIYYRHCYSTWEEMDTVVSAHSSQGEVGQYCSDSEDDQKITAERNNEQTSYYSSETTEPGINTTKTAMEQNMRRKLQFFFMNPIEKWKAKGRFPYKFAVQLIKILLVTFQLCLFAHSRYNYVNYTWDNRIAFSHLFLKGWDSTREVNAYPPAAGPLAIYDKNDFYDTIDFACDGYANLTNAIGSYSYTSDDNTMVPPKLCLYHYNKAIINGFNESFVFDSTINLTCLNITRGDNEMYHSTRNLLKENIDINFAALVQATLSFSIMTVNLRVAGPLTPPDCYRFDIEIAMDNEDFDGQMLLQLDAQPYRLVCNGDSLYYTDTQIEQVLRSILNIFVILICSVSLCLCSRAIFRAMLLKRTTVEFFRKVYDKELSFDSKLEFLNLWYITIIVNDVLLIVGSAIKEQIERKNFINDQWNICSLLLGVGNLLVWFGLLRYLGFFKTYNVVILTLKKAAPKISRFLICALLIYAGFTFCGWLILGPYHIKFRSLATTSECLFSLINGDDMFATFSIMSQKSSMLWWFSRIYLYSFISLYIYVVLSLFISVIMDAYDTIKKYYKDGFPKSDLQIFIGTTRIEDVSSGLYRAESSTSISTMIKSFLCCNCLEVTYSKLDPRGTNNSSAANGATCI